MTTNARAGDITALVEQITALGGTVPAELQSTIDTIAAVNTWTSPKPTDITSLVRRGELTADNAGDVLDAALHQPTITDGDLKVKAKAALVQRFAEQIAGPAGDEIIDSIRPAFAKSCKAIADAAQIVDHTVRADDLAEADDTFIAAWRTIGEHRATLNRVDALTRTLTDRFEVLGTPQPWHGRNWHLAALHTPDVAHLDLVGRALAQPNGTGGPRGGKWHQIASALQLNTISSARAILAEAHREHREREAADYAATHGTLAQAH